MKNKSTFFNKTRSTHLTWLGVLMGTVILFATCYDWTTINQPAQAYTNSTFTVSVVLKPYTGTNFAYDLANYGCFGVLLPDGWTVKDSIPYSSKGIGQNTLLPYDSTGYVIYDAAYAKMYKDSSSVNYVGRTISGWLSGNNVRNYDTPAGYHWWGGKTSKKARIDNLDSISLTVTIHTDNQTGNFNLRYGMGTLDWNVRTPVVEGGMSELKPITILAATKVNTTLKDRVSVYPNPATTVMNIDLGSSTKGDFQLFDLTGRVQLREHLTTRLHTIDVRGFTPGTYFVRLQTDQGDYTQKIIFRK